MTMIENPIPFVKLYS